MARRTCCPTNANHFDLDCAVALLAADTEALPTPWPHGFMHQGIATKTPRPRAVWTETLEAPLHGQGPPVLLLPLGTFTSEAMRTHGPAPQITKWRLRDLLHNHTPCGFPLRHSLRSPRRRRRRRLVPAWRNDAQRTPSTLTLCSYEVEIMQPPLPPVSPPHFPKPLFTTSAAEGLLGTSVKSRSCAPAAQRRPGRRLRKNCMFLLCDGMAQRNCLPTNTRVFSPTRAVTCLAPRLTQAVT